MSHRVQIWEENRAIAMLALAHLIEECEALEEEPIVIVADVKDATAKKIADSFAAIIETRDDIEAIVVASQNGATIIIMPLRVAANFLKSANAECAEILDDEIPEDHMWVAIFADEGVSLLQVPIAPLLAIGTA